MDKKRFKLTALIFFAMAAMVLYSGCSGDKMEDLPQYEGWEAYSYKHFVYHFPPDNYWGRNMDRFSTAFERYLAEDCDFLAIEIPEDTIHFYIYDNLKSGMELTGRQLPFNTGNQIHWGRLTPFGLELARYLIDRMGIRKTDFDFLYDGLAALRDYSGQDYHHLTAALLDMKKFIPLDTLFDNKAYARADSSHREWEAASFVAFITYNFGINRFKMLWQTTASFERAIKEIFGMDLMTFEDNWLQFAMVHYEGIRREVIYQDTTNSE